MSLMFDAASVYPNEASPIVTEALGPYLGLDVLSVHHNARDRMAETFARKADTLQSRTTGLRRWYDLAGAPMPVRTFQWTAADRTSANAVRDFLDARRGRLVPFWVPTCRRDLTLASDHLAAYTYLDVMRSGYVDYYFPQTSRRYLAIYSPATGTLLRKVNSAAQQSATVDRLVLDAALGADLVGAVTVVSYLVLCRLAEDLTRIRWFRTWGCEAGLRFLELPHEVPA